MSGAGTAAAEHVAATPARDRRKAKAAAAWRRRGLVLLFLSPWLIGFSIFIGIPLIVTVGLSFTRYNLLGDPTWVGLANYERMFTTDRRCGRRSATRSGSWRSPVPFGSSSPSGSR